VVRFALVIVKSKAIFFKLRKLRTMKLECVWSPT